MKLTLNLEEEIELLDKYRLTSDELMFIRVTLLYQDEENKELFSKYFKVLKQNNVNIRELLVSLQNKQVLIKSYRIPKEGETLNPLEIQFNKNFIKYLYKCSFELGKELFENYIQFGSINGCVISLRGVSKHFNSLEEAYYRYGKAIGWNLERHNHIIELLKWANEHEGIINQSLSSFIINNGWIDLEALKNGDKGNINYDSIKLL